MAWHGRPNGLFPMWPGVTRLVPRVLRTALVQSIHLAEASFFISSEFVIFHCITEGPQFHLFPKPA
jgi:hypothetical protein